MGFRLQSHYTLVIVGLIVAIVAALTTILLDQFRNTIETLTAKSTEIAAQDLLKQTDRRAQTMVRFLSENLVNPLYQYDMEAIYQLIQAGLSQNDITAIHVFDDEGKIVHDGTELIDSFGNQSLPPQVTEGIHQKNQFVKWKTGESFHIAYPIWIGEKPLGGVHVTLSLLPIQTDIRRMEEDLRTTAVNGLGTNLWTTFYTSLGLISLGILLSYYVSRGLIKPIRKLSQYAGQVGHGNYTMPIAIDRKDEIGDLANALREMSANLLRTTEETRRLAYMDSLTHLPNRLMFREYLDHTIRYTERQNQILAILFIDLDDFKRVNDTLGHDAGDILLKEVAQRIQSSIRSEDYVSKGSGEPDSPNMARLGGDEFTILLSPIKAPLDGAIVARRIISDLLQPFLIQEREVVVGASIGITIFPHDGQSSDILLKNADLAMYHAKEKGKNQYQFFTGSLNAAILHKLAVESDLRKALEHEEFQLWYQPILSLESRSIVGFEALIRWVHPKQGMIPPIQFIPVAEETGLVIPMGEWVLHTACRHAKPWPDLNGSRPFVAVNVSSIQFERQEVSDIVRKALTQNHLEPSSLHIEMTETAFMHHEKTLNEILETLKEMGIEIWLDDFGTGYSSLSYLRRFPVAGVKIDRSFINGTETNRQDRELTSAIIAMAHNLDLGVVAEGVETESQLHFLEEKRCDAVQGYYFSKPLPYDQVEGLLKNAIDQRVNQ